MFNIMICNITKIRIRLSICTSSEVVLSSICSLTLKCVGTLITWPYTAVAGNMSRRSATMTSDPSHT